MRKTHVNKPSKIQRDMAITKNVPRRLSYESISPEKPKER